ncbi:MAG: HD domain-containing protein [Candidatus Micrarchaeota archaeon]|nr:HD domain-containing protein [Candidatus Micrarchaeota archaeon]
MLETMNEVLEARLKPYKNAKTLLNFLRNDKQVNYLLEAANAVAIQRLGYNDHGVTHSTITTFNAVKMLQLLNESGITPNLPKESRLAKFEDSLEVVIAAAYLHDIGNAVMRGEHELFSLILAKDILNRFYEKTTPLNERKKAMVLEGIICHMGNPAWPPTSLEAKIIPVADACDMQEGRARIPYSLGKKDIHGLSALAIKKVRIKEGKKKPLQIYVEMDSSAGVFQIEELLLRKIKAASFESYVEITANILSRKEVLTYLD